MSEQSGDPTDNDQCRTFLGPQLEEESKASSNADADADRTRIISVVFYSREVARTSQRGGPAPDAEVHDSAAHLLKVTAVPNLSSVGAVVEIDGQRIQIEALERGSRFAVDVLPHTSESSPIERIIQIIATPGTAVSEYTSETGRANLTKRCRLSADLVYVQNADLLVSEGKLTDISKLLVTQIHIWSREGAAQCVLLVTTGRSGVTMREVFTGMVVRVHGDRSDRGAHFVYQVVTPDEDSPRGARMELRILVGPRATVEVYEPETPPAGRSDANSARIVLKLYETDDIGRIPPQGAPLEPTFLKKIGTPREPDSRSGSLSAASAGIPARAESPGKPSRLRSFFNRCITSLAGLLRFVRQGSARVVGQDGRGAVTLARKFGRTVDEIEALVARACLITEQDRDAIARIDLAVRTDGRVDSEDLRHVRESLKHLGFVVDWPPSLGDIFLFPDVGPGILGPWGPVGETMELISMHEAGKQGIGAARKPRHHVFPQEHREWFEERGFVGEHDIDNYTIEMDQSSHQAIHGGGNWQRGRTWDGEWNCRIMKQLRNYERHLGRRATVDEVLMRARLEMLRVGIESDFVPYGAP